MPINFRVEAAIEVDSREGPHLGQRSRDDMVTGSDTRRITRRPVMRKSQSRLLFIMRPSSLGGGRILRRTLSVRLSVRPVMVAERHVAPPSELQ